MSGTATNSRRKLIQLIHIGKAKLGLTEEAYRAFLGGVTGKQSCAEMDEIQLSDVLRTMRRNGFDQLPQATRKRQRTQPEVKGMATPAQLAYIRGMWKKCARNKSEEALLAFVGRIAHVRTMHSLTTLGAKDVILALRKMQAMMPDPPEGLDA
jgi:phage gp16-like protein